MIMQFSLLNTNTFLMVYYYTYVACAPQWKSLLSCYYNVYAMMSVCYLYSMCYLEMLCNDRV